MDRRTFILSAGVGGALAAAGTAAYRWWRHMPVRVHYPGRTEGHFLRDRAGASPLPAPAEVIETDVVILGSGIAGLTAAWKLRKEGLQDFLMIEGPEPFGNAAGGRHGELAYPTGAHYLPLPSPESVHVRELLHDLGVIQKNPASRRPYYDERFILHAPEERLLFQGAWQEHILPRDGIPAWEKAEQDRFGRETARLSAMRGNDGRRLFVLPLVQSSADPAWRALDGLSMKAWLQQNGFRAPSLHWYADYCCRDDYGVGYDRVSAWAGLHYFCSRGGEAENAGDGAWLTWPDGLQPLAAGLDRLAGSRRKRGTAIAVGPYGRGVAARCFTLTDGQPASFLVKARKAICAMPLHVAARVVDRIEDFGFDAGSHMPAYAPWLVANFLLRGFPEELPAQPLSWDNVVYGGRGLGYVVSTHQDIRAAPPARTVFTSYVALDHMTPETARRWLQEATPDALLDLAAMDLHTAYGAGFARQVERVDITVRAHAMASPRVGFLENAGLQSLRAADGPILFAHADLSGISVFEEAAWWGYQAARKALA